MSGYPFNCKICGRFATAGTWAYQYDFVAMEPSYDSERCQPCTDKIGPALSNARPCNNVWDQYEGRIVNGEYEYGSLVPSRSAQGMAARSGETEGLDPKGNSPVPNGDAPND